MFGSIPREAYTYLNNIATEQYLRKAQENAKCAEDAAAQAKSEYENAVAAAAEVNFQRNYILHVNNFDSALYF
ncbi:MAG: hypothetical protein ACO3P3_05315 [Candidatus Nanopelagicales bacterium]